MTSELEWRRRWRPTLSAQPWRPLTVGGDQFLIKFNLVADESYEFLMTNTESLWYEELDDTQAKTRTKKLNPSIEAPISKILDHISDSLDRAQENDKDVNLTAAFKRLNEGEDKKVILTLSTKLAGLPFVWKFSGTPAESRMVSDHLTVPLLSMVGELSRRQSELYKLLKAKDKEIDDLKSQGIKVSRRHLETPVFDETVFKHSMSTSKAFSQQVKGECTLAFDSDGQELYRDIMTKHAYINRPDDQDEDAEDDGTFSGEGTSADNGTPAPSWANRLPPSVTSGSVSPRKSPHASPTKSPVKSPAKSPQKDVELQRRQELEQKLEQEEERKQQKKKKKKMKF